MSARDRRERNETFELWYALGRLYSKAESARRRAARLGFTATLLTGAAVLLSAPVFGVSWLGAFAPAVPLLAGLAAGFGMFAGERASFRRREASIRGALEERGFDGRRPAKQGLSAYYDAQLVLLRSEYEYLTEKGAKRSARLLEDSFGFTPEDPFETGPLNVLTDTQEMHALKERWERRLSMRRERGVEPPELGLREDRAYRVFPREMTVGAERAAREAYLTISRSLIRARFGKDPETLEIPEDLKKRIRRDLEEYEELTGETSTRGASTRPDREGRRG